MWFLLQELTDIATASVFLDGQEGMLQGRLSGNDSSNGKSPSIICPNTLILTLLGCHRFQHHKKELGFTGFQAHCPHL